MSNGIPQAVESEREILGACLVGRLDFQAVQEGIDFDDLYAPHHRQLADAMADQINQDGAVDGPLLMSKLDGKALETAGDLLGGAYLLGRSYQSHLRAIRDTAQRRRLIEAANEIVGNAAGAESGEAAIGEAQEQMLRMAAGQQASGPISITDAAKSWVEELERRYEDVGDTMGVPTGFKSVDEVMGSMEGGELIVMAGRPGQGKTTLAMNMASNAMLRADKGVLVFSLEMSSNELVNRLAASVGSIDMSALKQPRKHLQDEDWPKITHAMQSLHGKPMYIDDTGGLHINKLRSRARIATQKHDIQLIVVDYLNLVNASGNSRYESTTVATNQLKAMAKELNVPVIVLAQLNREVDKRPVPRPVMSDLRDSGAIEQDGDKIVFLYRPASYDGHEDEGDYAEIIIAKNRAGVTGEARLDWQGKYNRFREFDDGYDAMAAPYM